MSSNNSGLVLQCSAAFAITAPVATVIAATMQTDPTVAVVTELQVPLTENWIATDVYISPIGCDLKNDESIHDYMEQLHQSVIASNLTSI